MNLFRKLLLSFLAVVLIGVVVASYLANQGAAREVSGFMFGQGMTTQAGLVQELAGYYRGRGSWDGVQGLLARGHGAGGMGHMMGQRLIVADAQGRVVADTADSLRGQALSARELASGLPVEVDGRRAGTLIARGGMGMGGGALPDASEAALLARVNRSIWVAALAAGAAALLVGGLLAYGITRPLRRLTAAANAVAGGDLSIRVPVTSSDEVGALAAAFNSMTRGLQAAERQRRDMTADIAHELRNPLAVLQGNIEAVIDGVLPANAETLQSLHEQTRVLARLVEDLRTLALADAGQLGLERVPVEPEAIVRAAAARFEALARNKGVTLDCDVAPGMPSVHVDLERLAQVLDNLITNALRHTPAAGRVILRARAAGPLEPAGVAFEIEDSGSGIHPADLPHIFDRFYRADQSRSRAAGGTGLGLSIARKLVEAHGGAIRAASEPGRGTSITLTLPS